MEKTPQNRFTFEHPVHNKIEKKKPEKESAQAAKEESKPQPNLPEIGSVLIARRREKQKSLQIQRRMGKGIDSTKSIKQSPGFLDNQRPLPSSTEDAAESGDRDAHGPPREGRLHRESSGPAAKTHLRKRSQSRTDKNSSVVRFTRSQEAHPGDETSKKPSRSSSSRSSFRSTSRDPAKIIAHKTPSPVLPEAGEETVSTTKRKSQTKALSNWFTGKTSTRSIAVPNEIEKVETEFPAPDQDNESELPLFWPEAKDFLRSDEGKQTLEKLKACARNRYCIEAVLAWEILESIIKNTPAEGRETNAEVLLESLGKLFDMRTAVKGQTDYALNLSLAQWNQIGNAIKTPNILNVKAAVTTTRSALDNMLTGIWANYLRDVAGGKTFDPQ